jgi:hypothetical protein
MNEKLKIFALNFGNEAICIEDMPDGWGWKKGQTQKIDANFLWDCQCYLKDNNFYYCSCGAKANNANGLPKDFIEYWGTK